MIARYSKNGWSIEFSMTWTQSLFKRIGYVKRKATTAKVPISPGFANAVDLPGENK